MTGEARVDNNSIRGYKDITCPGEPLVKITEETVTTSGTSSSGSDDGVIVVNGKTYTKAQLEAVLKNL